MPEAPEDASKPPKERNIFAEWLSEDEAAAALGKSVRTLRKWRHLRSAVSCFRWRLIAARMLAVKQFLEFVIRQLVEFPDEVMLSEIPSGRTTLFRVQMRQTDVGRIIGRNGQTIRAIRALLTSSAARHEQRATLEIVE